MLVLPSLPQFQHVYFDISISILAFVIILTLSILRVFLNPSAKNVKIVLWNASSVDSAAKLHEVMLQLRQSSLTWRSWDPLWPSVHDDGQRLPGLSLAKATAKRKVIPYYPPIVHAPGTSILGVATSRSGMLVPMATSGPQLPPAEPTPATSTLIRRMSTRPTETIAPTAFPSAALCCARSPYCAFLGRPPSRGSTA